MKQEQNVLQMEGVLAKGYGCIAKFAMQDPELTITDKGLYAYLVSLAGGGLTTWPARKTILSQLNICKTSYYKAQKNLLAHGYLKLEHQRKQGRWARAVYTICLNPKKYQEREAGQSQPPGWSVVTSSTMLSSGYGLLPKAVMQDERFGAKEKAVYAYFVTYANVGTMAYPIQEAVERELGISNWAFKTYLKKLTDCGYIIVKNRREKDGCFGVCDYFIALFPYEDGSPAPNGEYTYYETRWASQSDSPHYKKWDTVESEPLPPKQDTVKSGPLLPKQDTAESEPHPKKQDTVEAQPLPPKQDTVKTQPLPPKQDTAEVQRFLSKQDKVVPEPHHKKWDTVESEPLPPKQDTVEPQPHPKKQDTVDSDRTIKNGTWQNGTRVDGTRADRTQSNTTMSITTISNTSSFKEEEDRAAPPPEQPPVEEAVRAAGGIPQAFVGKAALTRQAIRSLVFWNPFAQEIGRDERRAAAWELALKAFEQLCTRQRSRVRENGKLRTVVPQQVVDLFNANCVDHYAGDSSADDFFYWLTDEYLDALEDRSDNAKGPLTAPLSYARFVIWTAMNRWAAEKERVLSTLDMGLV